jgi:hypothetical protein
VSKNTPEINLDDNHAEWPSDPENQRILILDFLRQALAAKWAEHVLSKSHIDDFCLDTTSMAILDKPAATLDLFADCDSIRSAVISIAEKSPNGQSLFRNSGTAAKQQIQHIIQEVLSNFLITTEATNPTNPIHSDQTITKYATSSLALLLSGKAHNCALHVIHAVSGGETS